jgi:flagellar biosynthesis GTPase FlhF
MAAPAFICRNAEELKDALEQTAQCDLVLIDTAGRADKGSILKQAQLLESFPDIEVYLTLSLASGPTQMAGTVSRYRTTQRHGTIMTKLD